MIFLEINIEDINKFNPFNIIDLRSSYKYEKKHINGSRNISYYYLIVEPEKYLKKNEKYLLICDYGLQSRDVCNILNKGGYNVYSLSGGMKKNEKYF